MFRAADSAGRLRCAPSLVWFAHSILGMVDPLLTSASTGSGLSLSQSDSASLLASWFQASGRAHLATLPFLFSWGGGDRSHGRQKQRGPAAMKRHRNLFALSAFAVVVCAACNSSTGRPGPGSDVIPPDQIVGSTASSTELCGMPRTSVNGERRSLCGIRFLAIADDTADSPPPLQWSTWHGDACLCASLAECSPTNRSMSG